MAKMIIRREAEAPLEVQISKERLTMGRHHHNDIVLENRAVSGEHAAIVTILRESFLEDLDSTNGTFVNGHRISKHFLQPNDVIMIEKYKIQFFPDPPAELGSASPNRAPAPRVERRSSAAPVPVTLPLGNIDVLNGANAGKRLVLTKTATTMGRPGVQVVVVSRRIEGYFIAHIEGTVPPLVNKQPVGAAPRALCHGDVIDLSGTEMVFSLA